MPEGAADAFATDGTVGNEIFEVGVFANAWTHDDRQSGDAENFAVFFGDE